VKLIGTHSNGTGAGFTYQDSRTALNWRDNYYVLSTQIPNFLFGNPGGQVGNFIYPSSVESLNSENKPVMADVTYDVTMDDVLKNDAGWINKAIEVLNQP
jgi:hypothetical protein